MSGILLDLIVVAFIVLVGMFFKKKGFIMALFSFVSVFISFVAAALLRPAVFAVLTYIGIVSESASPVALLVINIILYFTISIIVSAVLFWAGRILKLFSMLPVISSLDSVLGLILGVMFGVIMCSVAFSVIGMAEYWVNTQKVLSIIKDSYISEIFYKNNLFLILQ
ncbi:MAG: CvpA family protein [Ruminococcaceae bacterium]|nr:CvpA family protein [Oscillospiraceae bacterium]